MSYPIRSSRSPRTLALALLVLLASSTGAAAQGAKIGVFDVNKILTSSRLGQQLQDELNQFRVQREADIKKRTDELKRLLDQYKAGVDSMSAERREAMEGDITQRRRDLDRVAKDAEIDLQGRRQRAVREIERHVGEVLDDYGKRNGFTVILQRDLCAFSADSIDITDDIVKLVDARRG